MSEPLRRAEGHLKRLPAEYYRGDAYVHWSLTMEDRKTGWLTPIFYYKFRELLTHTGFRYRICCPLFCCMPDHIHMLWTGTSGDSDQLVAMKFLRRHLNQVLQHYAVSLQTQGFDHVLKDHERLPEAFEAVAEYIARNPERKGLVAHDRFADYPYTNCLVPGYPELRPFDDQYWTRFWRAYSYLRNANGQRGGGADNANSTAREPSEVYATLATEILP